MPIEDNSINFGSEKSLIERKFIDIYFSFVRSLVVSAIERVTFLLYAFWVKIELFFPKKKKKELERQNKRCEPSDEYIDNCTWPESKVRSNCSQ